MTDEEPTDEWLYLDGGTFDFGYIRSARGWPALRWVLIRPWRWYRIPHIVRHWRDDDGFLTALQETLGQPMEIRAVKREDS